MLDRNYSYDGLGNITEIDRNSMPDDLTPVYPYSYTDDYSYSTQSASSILQIDNGDLTQTHAYYAHNIIGDVTVTKQYAIHGELTKELHLTWNEDHRLTEVKNGANQTLATYTYNGLGQRVKKHTTTDNKTTIYLYDLQGNMISEMRSDGTYDDYLYLENQRIAKITNSGAIYYYHNDHLDTPIVMTNSSGTVVWKAAYKTFGEAVVDSSSSITNNFRFPGQYYDEETGLHYNYHRYYDPGTGRYVSADPILQPTLLKERENVLVFSVPFFIKMPEYYNQYLYVYQNPINKIDADGLGIIDLVFCFYYGKKIAPFVKKCENECPNDLENTAKFIEKYTTSGSLSIAMMGCVCKNAGDQLCTKWLASCFKGPIGIGPKIR